MFVLNSLRKLLFYYLFIYLFVVKSASSIACWLPEIISEVTASVHVVKTSEWNSVDNILQHHQPPTPYTTKQL